jgi:hypothetical protein
MGSSPRADIFFGLYLGNEGTWANDPKWSELPEWVTEQDLRKHLADLAGLKEPTVEYKWNGSNPEYEAHCEATSALEDACPIEIVTGGSNESGVLDYSLAIKASHTHTDWDSNPHPLKGTPLMAHGNNPPDDWTADLYKWAVEKLGIPLERIAAANPNGPAWHIVTSTG